MTTSIARICVACGDELVRRPGEQSTHFKARTKCSRSCGQSLAERFRVKVNMNGPIVRAELGPCHMWTARTDPAGYGRITFNGLPEKASRVAFFLAHGRWPDPCALHRCDNPPCVKAFPDEHGPAHLFEGTKADNAHDRDEKGRDWQSQRTHCPAGHPYDATNAYPGDSNPKRKKKQRRCRTCHLLGGIRRRHGTQ
jgi:hypothetical protein